MFMLLKEGWGDGPLENDGIGEVDLLPGTDKGKGDVERPKRGRVGDAGGRELCCCSNWDGTEGKGTVGGGLGGGRS